LANICGDGQNIDQLDYYITYTDQEGKTVEAMLSNPGDHKFKEGDRLRIKYLPDKQEYPVMVETVE
jgi:hypothetical protein